MFQYYERLELLSTLFLIHYCVVFFTIGHDYVEEKGIYVRKSSVPYINNIINW